MNTDSLPAYNEILQMIDDAGSEVHPSEIHGMMSGILSAGDDKQVKWSEVVKNYLPSEKPYQAWECIYQLSAKQLNEFMFEFQLFLPDDDTHLIVRAEALTVWCQGYLTGLKLAGIELIAREPSELTEAIKDLTEIAQMNYEDVVDSEENETDYIELIEYVRMAVIYIYQTLHEKDSQPSNINVH